MQLYEQRQNKICKHTAKKCCLFCRECYSDSHCMYHHSIGCLSSLSSLHVVEPLIRVPQLHYWGCAIRSLKYETARTTYQIAPVFKYWKVSKLYNSFGETLMSGSKLQKSTLNIYGQNYIATHYNQVLIQCFSFF